MTVFTACEEQESNFTQISNVKEYSIPQENKHGVHSDSISPSSDLNGFYSINSVSKSVSFYDAEIGKSIVMCAQTGCAHTDETCQAWIGNVNYFVEYHGEILATIQYEDGSAGFVKKNLSGGKIDTLYTWNSNNTESYEASIGRVADNTVVIYLQHYIIDEHNDYEVIEEATYWQSDLDNDEMQQMFPNEQVESIDILAISKDYAFVMFTQSDQEEYSTDADYEDHFFETPQRELRLYDMNEYTYVVVVDMEHDNFIVPSDASLTYGNEVVYQCNDDIYLFDMTSKESKKSLLWKE